jgi:hypothetical protein
MAVFVELADCYIKPDFAQYTFSVNCCLVIIVQLIFYCLLTCYHQINKNVNF